MGKFTNGVQIIACIFALSLSVNVSGEVLSIFDSSPKTTYDDLTVTLLPVTNASEEYLSTIETIGVELTILDWDGNYSGKLLPNIKRLNRLTVKGSDCRGSILDTLLEPIQKLDYLKIECEDVSGLEAFAKLILISEIVVSGIQKDVNFAKQLRKIISVQNGIDISYNPGLLSLS